MTPVSDVNAIIVDNRAQLAWQTYWIKSCSDPTKSQSYINTTSYIYTPVANFVCSETVMVM